ncbi:leucine-rich repeat-containing protein 37A2 [Phocoena sinus]|uniref:leucine-rich repeat-containing protein 37A2 n=1 Tax=Phocoena sinus TaxID=42100 RepID=UPI0013C3F33A|nr:leucine-rich repeat-containing protein 37A2 [Phocoena sinus]
MWLRLLTGLGHCAWEPPHVMSRLRLWLPRLFLTWLQLWLQVQAVQPPQWALGPVQVTPNPPRLTEAWSSYASDPPPKLPHALTPLAEARAFNYLTSWSPVEMLAPPHQELTETEAPHPDMGSVGELPTGPCSGEVEPSPTQQEQPAQPPEHHEMTVSPPSHPQGQQSNLSGVAVKPAYVELTITKEATPEVGPSPNQRKPSAQPSGPLTNAEFSTTQHEAPTLPSEPPEEVEPLPVQQEAPAQSPEAGTHNKPSVQEEPPAEYPEHPGEEFTPATASRRLQISIHRLLRLYLLHLSRKPQLSLQSLLARWNPLQLSLQGSLM